MGRKSKAKARKKQQPKSSGQMEKGHKIAQKQISQGGIPSTLYESEQKDLHISIISMPDCTKINAYGDMNNPEWLQALKSLGLKENGTITDSTAYCDCPLCHGTGTIPDSLN